MGLIIRLLGSLLLLWQENFGLPSLMNLPLTYDQPPPKKKKEQKTEFGIDRNVSIGPFSVDNKYTC